MGANLDKMMNSLVETEICVTCNREFVRRKKAGTVKRMQGVRRVGAINCCTKCSKEYVFRKCREGRYET